MILSAHPLWHLCHVTGMTCSISGDVISLLFPSLPTHTEDWWLRKSPHWYTRRPGRETSGLIKLEERDTGDAVLSPLPSVTARVLTSHQKAGLWQPALTVETVSAVSSFRSFLTAHQWPCPYGVQTGVPRTGSRYQLWILIHPCEQHVLQAHIWHHPWEWAQQWVRQASTCLFRP